MQDGLLKITSLILQGTDTLAKLVSIHLIIQSKFDVCDQSLNKMSSKLFRHLLNRSSRAQIPLSLFVRSRQPYHERRKCDRDLSKGVPASADLRLDVEALLHPNNHRWRFPE